MRSKKRLPTTTDRQVEQLNLRRLIVQTLVALGIIVAILVAHLISAPLCPEPDPYHTVIIAPKTTEIGHVGATFTPPKMQVDHVGAVLGPPIPGNTGTASSAPANRTMQTGYVGAGLRACPLSSMIKGNHRWIVPTNAAQMGREGAVLAPPKMKKGTASSAPTNRTTQMGREGAVLAPPRMSHQQQHSENAEEVIL